MWHYIPVRYKEKDGTWIYTVQESYKKYGNTLEKEGMCPIGESKKELIQCLELMLKDMKKYPTKTVKLEDIEKNRLDFEMALAKVNQRHKRTFRKLA